MQKISHFQIRECAISKYEKRIVVCMYFQIRMLLTFQQTARHTFQCQHQELRVN